MTYLLHTDIMPGAMILLVAHENVLILILPPQMNKIACQAPLSIGFPRQEYWIGLPFPSPGDLPNSGTEPWSPTLLVNFLPSKLPRKAGIYNNKPSLDYIFLYTNGVIKCHF